MDYDPCVEEFRALLRSRLIERGDLARLAEASGIASHVIGRWRNGEGRPTDTNLRKLAPVLGMSYEDLARMCGYLEGEPRQIDQTERELLMRAEQFKAALSNVPRAFWSVVTEASIRMAQAMPSHSTPVTSPQPDVVTQPDRSGNNGQTDPSGDLPIRKLQSATRLLATV